MSNRRTDRSTLDGQDGLLDRRMLDGRMMDRWTEAHMIDGQTEGWTDRLKLRHDTQLQFCRFQECFKTMLSKGAAVHVVELCYECGDTFLVKNPSVISSCSVK